MDGPVSGLEFRSMVGVEQLSQPFRYDVEFLSDADALEPNAFLGHPMTVHLELKDRTLRHFNGMITDFSPRGRVGKKNCFAVTLRPLLWLLTQRVNSKIHAGTAVQIVKGVFADKPYADAKVDVIEKALDDIELNYEFVVQHEESDFNFVMRILERDGIYFYFEHTAGKHSLVLTTSEAYTVDKYGSLEFTVTETAPQKQQEYIDQFVRHSSLTPGTFAVSDFDYTAPKNPLLVEVVMGRGHPLGEFEVFHFPGGYVDTEFGRAIARRRLEALQVSGERFDGQGNARCLGAGQLFSLVGHPEDTVNTDYMVYSVSFALRTHDHQSGGALAGSDVMRANFVALDRAKPFRPPLRTPKPRIFGVQSAVVVGPEGQEIETDPDGFGRVKVKFHWDRSEVTDGSNCCWIRVSQPWAGSNFGALFTPRIGQEVLVEFINGDPDLPIITGRVYNNDHMPPYDLPGNNTQSGIKTLSSPWADLAHHNEIRFEDKLGSEELFVQAQKTHTVNVKGSRSVSVGGTQSTSVTGKETRNYKAERHTDVKGKDSLKVADGDKTTDVDKLYEIKTKLGFKVADDTSTKAELASKKILLDAPDEIKLKVMGSEVTIKPESIEIKTKTLTINGTTITIDGTTSVKLTGATDKSLELAGDGATLKGGTQVAISGSTVKVDGPMGIKLNS